MKIFLIHSNSDNQTIAPKLQTILDACPSAEILSLTGNKKFWHKEALTKIKQADFAIYFVGKKSHESPYIEWEIKQFKRLNKKIFTVKLDKGNEYNESLYRKEMYGNTGKKNDTQLISSEETLEDIINKINNRLEVDINKSLKTEAKENDEFLIEQYKAYLQTSEDVVSRRQTVSNFYISINSTIITIFATLITVLTALNPENMEVIIIAVAVLFFVLGILLCINWIKILDTYGKLNSAKMAVISKLEEQLSAKIYETEWKVQTDKIGSKKYNSFTSIEKKVPKIFFGLYAALLVLAVIIVII